MKNKNFRYFLIAAVVVVWGTIIFRVVAAIGDTHTPAPLPNIRMPVSELSVEDSFELYADYPDPFLPEIDSTSKDSLIQKQGLASGFPARDSIDQLTPQAVASMVQLTGIISNPQKKTRIALLVIHNREYMVKEKERVEDLIVKKIGRNNIEIIYKGRSFIILKMG